jgi:serine protease DegS
MNTFVRFFLPPAGLGLLIALLVILFLSHPTAEQNGVVLVEEKTSHSDSASRRPLSYADAVERAQPAVVNIYTTKIVTRSYHPLYDDPNFRRFFGMNEAPQRQRMLSSLGSGVIVSKSGYVLTNNHVIEGADEIKILLQDGRESLASLVGADPETDLAVLYIETPNLPTITLTTSGQIRVGDIVLAIGNPFGVGQTVTEGIVSALGRNQNNISTFVDFIQTDAAINPGNSGGALINAQGELIGINTAIYSKTGSSTGIGFAIPVDLAKQVLMAIVKNGEVVRGWIGIEPQVMTEAIAKALKVEFMQGLLVAGVFEQGPAHKAGVLPGDIITHINGKDVSDPRAAMGMITALRPGDSVKLQVYRQNQSQRIIVRVEARPSPT